MEDAALAASMTFQFSGETHSVPHSNSALITAENVFYGGC